ncbi:Hypothetical protein IALB_2284 [Ignavibacterium album JCM 16511]|uniref:Uncharacterized protein n=1 Tax=Ignavibacterium album (strain DSM 19864 / JCM 16511 / NBRC 101810 / Mat9-16) TaxID=945713 RepID=I0ALY0_IGNAJ|nr:Hypothetical protein IALB_2284 [Ignavibacterium album JCM 16511]
MLFVKCSKVKKLPYLKLSLSVARLSGNKVRISDAITGRYLLFGLITIVYAFILIFHIRITIFNFQFKFHWRKIFR